MITYDDANYMIEFEGFTLLGTLTSGKRLLTRSAIDAYMNADSSLYSTYASNRLVPYQLLTPAIDCTLSITSTETYDIPSAPTTPGIPTFSLTTISGYRVNFTGSTDESGIKRYEVSKDGGATAISTGLSLFYDNLDTAGIESSWLVRSIDNTDVVSAWSGSASWQTLTEPPVLAFESKTGSSITFSRTHVSPGVASYWTTLAGQESGFWLQGGSTIEIVSLSVGDYTIRMQTKNLYGLLSPFSNTLYVTLTAQAVPCNSSFSYPSGEQSYPTITSVDLGSGTGISTLTYDAKGIPDRFIAKWNGNVVIDTGYRGDSNYDYVGGNRQIFIDALLGKLDPITNNTYPDIGTYPDDGYPRVISNPLGGFDVGKGTASFNKITSTSNIINLYVYAPLSGTAWEISSLSCPA